jgi:vacuolar-type H+-ATPase subunit I/STV1
MADQVSAAPQGQASAPIGQGAPAQAQQAPISQGSTSQPGQPFFKVKDPDGKEQVFNSPADLEKAWKESHLRQRDYTQKTMTHAQAVKQFQKEKEEHEKEYKQILAQKAEYEKYEKAMRTRPDIQKYLSQAVNQPANSQTVYERSTGYVDEKTGELSKKLEELEKWKEQQELERQRDGIYKEMKSEDPDFDEASVNEMLEELAPGDMRSLVKILWDAKRGRESPAKIEEKLKKNLEEKNGSRMMPGSGAPGGSRKYKTIKEAADAAMAELG